MRLHNAKDNIDAVLSESLLGTVGGAALKYGGKALAGMTKANAAKAAKLGVGGTAAYTAGNAVDNRTGDNVGKAWRGVKNAASNVKAAGWDNPLDAAGKWWASNPQADAARDAHIKSLTKSSAEKVAAREAAEKAAQAQRDAQAKNVLANSGTKPTLATSLKDGMTSAKNSIMTNSKAALEKVKRVATNKTAEVKKGIDSYQAGRAKAAELMAKLPKPAPIRPVAPAQPVLPPPPPPMPQAAYIPPPRPVQAPVQAPQPVPQAPQQTRVQRAQNFYGVGRNRQGSGGGPRR
jgi:hypothetical protein